MAQISWHFQNSGRIIICVNILNSYCPKYPQYHPPFVCKHGIPSHLALYIPYVCTDVEAFFSIWRETLLRLKLMDGASPKTSYDAAGNRNTLDHFFIAGFLCVWQQVEFFIPIYYFYLWFIILMLKMLNLLSLSFQKLPVRHLGPLRRTLHWASHELSSFLIPWS